MTMLRTRNKPASERNYFSHKKLFVPLQVKRGQGKKALLAEKY